MAILILLRQQVQAAHPPNAGVKMVIFIPIFCTIFVGSICGAPTTNNWEKCTEQDEATACRNGGQCFQDGSAQYCICPEGYGGKKCERLVDAWVLMDASLSPQQLLALCKLALFLLCCSGITAICGWTCCCMKHFNARRLYLRNLKLCSENDALHAQNRAQSKRSVRLYAALAHARGMCDESGEEAEAEAYSSCSPLSEEFRWADDNRQRSPQREAAPALPIAAKIPSKRRLSRQLSKMHDELRESIEEGVVEIVDQRSRRDQRSASQEAKEQWRRWSSRVRGWTILDKEDKKTMTTTTEDVESAEEDSEKKLLRANSSQV